MIPFSPKSSSLNDQPKLIRLLQSSQRSQVELAFQLFKTRGLPNVPNLETLLSNSGYKIAFCLKYGFGDYLRKLKKLYLYREVFDTLPSEIGKLRDLEEMEIRYAQIQYLPSQIAFLKYLKLLDLEDNLLRTLPDEVIYLANLEKLNLSFNRLSKLPENILHLRKLQFLSLKGNHFRTCPEYLSEMQSLRYLDLSDNPELVLSKKMALPPSLKTLVLNKSKVSSEIIHYFQRYFPRVKINLSSDS